MINQVLRIGKFELGVPSNLMYDIATLKVDLRPAVTNLMEATKKLEPKPYKYVKHIRKPAKPKKHTHLFKPYYSRFKCTGCGLKRRNLPKGAKLVLSQRLPQAKSQTEGSQNASGDPKRKANT